MLNLLTYNIHKAIGNDRVCDPGRIGQICSESAADVITLQEVDKNVPRSRHLDLARTIAQHLEFDHALGLNVSLKAGHYGNATLSRWPIIHNENIDLSWGIKKKRGCLASVIAAPWGEILVLNLHLGLSRIERHFQVRRVLDSRVLVGSGMRPVLIAGDTNERTRYLDIFMNLAGYKNASGTVHRKIKTWPTFAPIWNLDKIFFNNKLQLAEYQVLRNNLTRVASDHFPVLAKFTHVESQGTSAR